MYFVQSIIPTHRPYKYTQNLEVLTLNHHNGINKIYIATNYHNVDNKYLILNVNKTHKYKYRDAKKSIVNKYTYI